MERTLSKLQAAYPELKFKPAQQFCWSPKTQEIHYVKEAHWPAARWSLLHEAGHAVLNHKFYQSDFQLLKLEVEAWQQAKVLAGTIGLKINEDHIQDCLDTYRDWLYKRSICPTCHTKCLQLSDYAHYSCFNCHTTWRVTPSRFGRAYRSTKNISQPAVFRLSK